MLEHRDDLRSVDPEQGNPLAESRGRSNTPPPSFEWFGEEAKRSTGHDSDVHADRRVVVIKEPVGVTAGITPWNFRPR